jgi:hypothetical protein
VIPEDDDPTVVFCLDQFGPLNLMPHPGRHWAAISGKNKDPDREPRPRRRATYNRNDGVRHLFAAYDLTRDRLFGHVKTRKKRTQFLEFCRYLRSLYPPDVRMIRRYIIWRNRHADDTRLRQVVARANVA